MREKSRRLFHPLADANFDTADKIKKKAMDGRFEDGCGGHCWRRRWPEVVREERQ